MLNCLKVGLSPQKIECQRFGLGLLTSQFCLPLIMGWIYIWVAIRKHDQNYGHFPPAIPAVVKWGYIIQGSGQFFHDKMPDCCLLSLTAATTLQFIAGCLQLSLEQEPTPSFAFLGGYSPLPIRSTGAIILSSKKIPQPLI